MKHVRITATGSAVPSWTLDNEELVRRFNLSVPPEWIEAQTGIRQRHWLEPGETTSDLCVRAAERILEARDLAPRDLDRIVLATVSPDMPSPSTATIVQRKLGARCPAYDLSAACAGFLYGLDLGAASVRGGEECVLVIAADARSRFVDTRDHRGTVLFADGAAGALLEPSDEPGLLSVALGAEGRERPGAYVPAGGAELPTSAETVATGKHFIHVDGKREIFDLFVGYILEACGMALERAAISLDDIDLLITHQGNANLTHEIGEALGLPETKVVDCIATHGNTSGASVPIALDESLAAGRIAPGDTVLLASVGAGYTFGAAVHRF